MNMADKTAVCIYSVSGKNETKIVFCDIFCITREILMKIDIHFPK